jgi:glutamyl-tRNA reductase
VVAVARTVAQRLLHEPTLQVKQADGGVRHARMHVLRELFGLLDEELADIEAARR